MKKKTKRTKTKKVKELSLMTRIMALRSEYCPVCRYARVHPKTTIGRMVAWHGKWCPFWKAHKQVYGK